MLTFSVRVKGAFSGNDLTFQHVGRGHSSGVCPRTRHVDQKVDPLQSFADKLVVLTSDYNFILLDLLFAGISKKLSILHRFLPLKKARTLLFFFFLYRKSGIFFILNQCDSSEQLQSSSAAIFRRCFSVQADCCARVSPRQMAWIFFHCSSPSNFLRFVLCNSADLR